MQSINLVLYLVKLNKIIDSHVNFGHDLLKNKVGDIYHESINSGIERLLCINSNLFEFESDFKMVKDYEFIDLTIGHHPNNANDIKTDEVIKIIEKEIINSSKKIVGIGETGLDFHYDIPKRIQLECLEKHIELAIKYKLPIIIHMREAENEMINILQKYRDKLKNILIHCFTGSNFFAEKCMEMDCYYSLSGIITFKNSNKLRETIKILPLNRIIFETDSPYLTPVPNRGKINEPKYLEIIINFYADFLNLDVEQVKRESTMNYKNLFEIFKIND